MVLVALNQRTPLRGAEGGAAVTERSATGRLSVQREPVCEGESAGGFPTIPIPDFGIEIGRLVYIVSQATAKKPVAKGRAQRVSFCSDNLSRRISGCHLASASLPFASIIRA